MSDTSERQQLSAVAKALNWQRPYQASLAKRVEALIAERDSLRQQVDARDKMLRQKDEAMGALFELLDKACIDYSNLIN